jgi:hypothetical protein
MVCFCIPPKQAGGQESVQFSVASHPVLLAGSRHRIVPDELCQAIIQQFHHLGFHFYIGCAAGVDRCFRSALAESPYHNDGFVACAFASRVWQFRSLGLFAQVVVPPHLPPKAALARRTLWMVRRCSLAVLFPENPYDGRWGKGSRLVFRACMSHLKPVFVAGQNPPPISASHYQIVPGTLFELVCGYWAVPEGGQCGDEL